MVEVERLEGVKDEVAHILVHVCFENSSIEIINCSTSVHHLLISVYIHIIVLYYSDGIVLGGRCGLVCHLETCIHSHLYTMISEMEADIYIYYSTYLMGKHYL